MFVEKRFDTGEVEINFAEGGSSGPPLVLVPGLPGSWVEFTPILPALSTRWHVYALDMRGQGKSGRVPGGYLSSSYLEDLTAFLKHLDAPAVVFGASAGGVVAMEAAARNPNLVLALVVGDSPIDLDWLISWMTSDWFKDYFSLLRELAGLDMPLSELAEHIKKTPFPIPGKAVWIPYSEFPDVDAVKVLEMATTLHCLDPGVLEYHAEGRAEEFLCGLDLEKAARRINCPVLFIQADPECGGMMKDRSHPVVQAACPSALHFKLDGIGHDLGLSAWETGPLMRVVSGFLEGVIAAEEEVKRKNGYPGN